MNKLEKIDQQEQKAREKIAAMQAVLKQIDGQRTEQENLQIVQKIRALKLSRAELYAFINNGIMPGTVAEAVGNSDNAADTSAAPEPEPIYSRRGKSRRHNADGENASDTTSEQTAETPSYGTYGDTETTANNESEGLNHEGY